MRELRTEISIDAPPERVWDLLTDQEGLPAWNPFIREMTGDLTQGERIRVSLQQPGRKAMTFRPRLLRVSPGRELRWLGHMGVPGLFDGEHIFEILPGEGGGVRFVQRERFSGLLVPVLWRMLDRETREGFHGMNEALKARAEAAA